MRLVLLNALLAELFYLRWSMGPIPLIWVGWGVSLLVFIAFRVYVHRISRNEDDQLVLQASSARLVEEQQAIAARLQSVKPAGLAILALFGVMTLGVLGYYALDIVRQFQ